eukprot:CAMPEP_0113541924 /NCGR_PEP_ID=MMETSP0015_2-20120614/9315_1 /TAXON_ID=2838 /ORGANISM="Odontella" /LENGTH=247 /DNA_ID=CAMNT_0000441911 /DNA_START=65 /DNA_END=808 /DNA_ORIENTATION=+ /assembly_acc=CAM_ASM_000160
MAISLILSLIVVPISVRERSGLARRISDSHEYPELAVLDLDATFWNQEMYAMTSKPVRTVMGDLNGRGVGVVGAVCASEAGESEIRLYDGSLDVFQRHFVDCEYPDTKLLSASSADTPFAEQVARAALQLLEVVPGLTVWDAVVSRDWQGEDFNQIGRQASQGLSSNKARLHFPKIHALTGTQYDKMLLFDNCIWSDNVGMVQLACRENDTNVGSAVVRTPHGFTLEKWNEGLKIYDQQYRILHASH